MQAYDVYDSEGNYRQLFVCDSDCLRSALNTISPKIVRYDFIGPANDYVEAGETYYCDGCDEWYISRIILVKRDGL